MVDLQLLKNISSFPHLRCYQMQTSLQKDFLQKFSSEKQQKSYLITWKGIQQQIHQLKQNKKTHQEKLELYLNHAILLLRSPLFKQLLNLESVTQIPAQPDSLLHEQPFSQNIISQAIHILIASHSIMQSHDSLLHEQPFSQTMISQATQVLITSHSAIQYHEEKLMKARGAKDRKEEGIAYGVLGSVYDELGDQEQAITHHLKQLDIAEDIGDQSAKIMGSGNLGSAYFDLKEFDQALMHYEICLKLAQDIQEYSIEGAAYFNLGKTYQALHNPKQAAICYNRCLALSHTIQNKTLEKMALSKLEGLHQPLDELSQTEDGLKQYLLLAQKRGDRCSQGRAHAYLGDLYMRLKKHTQAIECYKKCLNIAIEYKDHSLVGKTYGRLGKLYIDLKQHNTALDCYESCLKIAKDISDNQMRIKAQLSLNNLYRSLGKYPELIKYYQDSLIYAKENRDRATEGLAYRHLGKVYQDSENHEEAINSYHQALIIAQELNNYVGEGKAYSNLGKNYHALEKYDQAIEFHEKHAMMAIRLGNLAQEGKAYLYQGKAYQALNKYPHAIEFYHRHLNISKQLQNLSEEATAYDNLALAYFDVGNYNTSLHYYEKYLKMAQDTQDLKMQLSAYMNLGAAYIPLHDQRGLESQEKALSLAKQLGDRFREGFIYHNLAIIYKNSYEFYEAIKYQNKSLMIAQELNNRKLESTIYGNLGHLHYALGEYQTASKYFVKAFDMHQTPQQKKQYEGTFFHDMGTIYQAQGDSAKALTYNQQALEKAQACNDRQGEMYARNSLGIIHQNLGRKIQQLLENNNKTLKTTTKNQQLSSQELKEQNLPFNTTAEDHYQKALTQYEAALEISKDLKDRLVEGKIRVNLGNLYGALNYLDKQLENTKNYLTIAKNVQDPMSLGLVHHNLGITYQRLSDTFQAETNYRQAIEIFSSLERSTKKSQWQVSLFEDWSRSYLNLEDLLIHKARDIEALEISDARRSRALSSLISQKLSLEKNQPLTYPQMRALAQTLKTTFIVYSLLNSNPDNIKLTIWVVSSHEEKLQSINLINSAPGEPCKFGIILPNEEFLKKSNIFKKFPYQAKIQRPQKNQKQPSQFFNERLSAWYDIFITPIKEYLPPKTFGDTLTFIPDGFLAHLPFGAFYNKKDKTHLIEHYPISISPSIQVLSLLNQYPKEFPDQSLLVANPLTHPDDQVSSLPKAEEEIKQLSALLKEQTLIRPLAPMIGTEATVSKIVERAPDARLIHIACHGIAGEKPTNSPDSIFEGFFKLAFVDQNTPHQLHAEEVASMTLKADLVFMSACHLGRGNLKQEGSIGPIWSFLGAGARSTIASYWPLPDSEVTVKIVEIFYKHLFGIGTSKLDKARALQQAILMVMDIEASPGKSKIRDFPRQWGAFFLSGLTE
ncbi:MAG: tetratricopeptide repeat protein [Candidatus Rhabdochlamydia sp.]